MAVEIINAIFPGMDFLHFITGFEKIKSVQEVTLDQEHAIKIYQFATSLGRFIFIAVALLVAGNYGIYSLFGTHKHDKVYTEKVVNAYEHPDDTLIVNDFKNYDASLRAKDTIKTKPELIK